MLLMQVASATITITPTDTGNSYIRWDWTSGELLDMYIDGNVMCGYDTLAQNYTLSDLACGSLHTISLVTAGDTGTNSTYTSTTNCTSTSVIIGSAGGLTQPDDSLFWTGAFVGLMGLIVVLGVTIRR